MVKGILPVRCALSIVCGIQRFLGFSEGYMLYSGAGCSDDN